jgi:hypothetical protein
MSSSRASRPVRPGRRDTLPGMSSLDQAPAVCARVEAAAAELAAAQTARDAFLVQLREAGVPGRQVAQQVRARLEAAGWDAGRIRSKVVGVSDGNVKRVLGIRGA